MMEDKMSHVFAPRDASHPMHQPRPNRRGGACGSCGQGVKVGQGTFVNTGNRYVVMHLPGQCPERPVQATTFAANRYPGKCADCGGWVEAEAGRRFQPFGGGRWQVAHLEGTCPERTAPVAPEQAVARANRFAGKCTGCGQWVEAEAGTCAKVEGRWVVSHAEGTCPEASTTAERQVTVPDVPAGHYATTSRTGNNDLDFWRVDRPKSGRTYVKRVIGGQPDTNVRFVTMVQALEAIVREGVEACRERYAAELGNCWKCNTHLTVGLSRLLKIGPECCKNVHGMTQRQLAASRGITADVINLLAKAEAAAKAGDPEDAELIEQAEAVLAAIELAAASE
jgi:hypothetical protein